MGDRGRLGVESALRGYRPVMPSAKTRLALKGGKYLVTHPRSRLTRLVVRFVGRRVGSRLARLTQTGVLSRSLALRIVVLGWIAAVVSGSVLLFGGIAFVVRRRRRRAAARLATAPRVTPPFPPSASTPLATRDAPPATPTTSPAAEAAAITGVHAAASDVGDGDDAVVARVQAKLFGGTPPLGLTVESNAGVVTLRGQVADEDAEVRFVRDAETIEGVKAVQSELQTAGIEPGPPTS